MCIKLRGQAERAKASGQVKTEDEDVGASQNLDRVCWTSDKERAGNNACSCHTGGSMMTRQSFVGEFCVQVSSESVKSQ